MGCMSKAAKFRWICAVCCRGSECTRRAGRFCYLIIAAEQGFCSCVDDTTCESKEWDVCRSDLLEDERGLVVLVVGGLRGPLTEAAIRAVIWEGMYGGYSAVVPEPDGGAGDDVS